MFINNEIGIYTCMFSALEKFDIIILIKLVTGSEVGSIDVSFTNASLYLLFVFITLMFWGFEALQSYV